VPAATPAAILNTLNSAAVRALRSKEVNERLSSEAAEIVASTPTQFAEFQKAEIAKWAGVVRKANLKLENY
jgi:tripartite-type tricarboxylate transporter receptor subunit TctC